ncbi:MAG: double-strand break repair protein AddB [Rhodospirillales bacterium]|nr:double-strand break repair protein AddB [Rhodospirillales bacterium]
MSARVDGDARPTVYAVPPYEPFVDALAGGILSGQAVPLDPSDPLALSRLTILLPTRRACRALGLAFLRAAPEPALLPPRIRPLGDIDEDEPSLGDEEDETLPDAVSPLERRLLLARLIQRLGETPGGAALTGAGALDQSARLARALADLLDEIQIARLDPQGLADLAPEEYAAHWRQVLSFLTIIMDTWPRHLAEKGLMDPAARRNALLKALAERWSAKPPAHPVIAAGSTGSVQATRDLLAVIARMPQGAVVLPGLEADADDETWKALGPTHPQYALKGLLDRIDVARGDVLPWPGDARAGTAAARARARLIANAMRPAETITAWRALPPPAPDALRDIHRIDCASPQEEAGVIAIVMRRALETPGRTAALVTADRALARRVTAELRRWQIEVDDSAGEPLGETAPGAFLRLTARMIAEQTAPVPLLAALKHPLAGGGEAPAAFRRSVRAMERAILRGPRPALGFAGLRAALKEDDGAIRSWLDGLEAAATPFASLMARPEAHLRELLQAHVALAEGLAATDDEAGAARLWAGEAGVQAVRFVTGLLEAAPTLPPVAPGHYPALLDALMEDHVVRPPYGRHPRLQIWGPLEARLQHADCMILGGLNEGGWPPATSGDPWMSRPMRADFGLPPPELRIGLSAHDFVQCCGAPEVYLTRARRIEGTPTIPARWLQRLDALLANASGGVAALRAMEPVLLAWWAALDRPAEPAGPRPAPTPTPPVAARPRQLSVTKIETWIADPYSIYAREILRLRPLDPVDADPSAAERGSIIHRILDAFVREHSRTLPPDAEARLLALGRAAFDEAGTRPGVLAFWWPRFERIARWFLDTERARRPALQPLATEVNGVLDLEGPAGPFRLTAKADRIDRTEAGALEIIDYKTGGVPAKRHVKDGRSPQLSLEAAISQSGGFMDVDAAEVGDLAYWKLSGAETAGEITQIDGDAGALAQAAADGLRALIARFDDPATPYHPVPRPALSSRWNDYAHLARHKEWSVPGGDN